MNKFTDADGKSTHKDAVTEEVVHSFDTSASPRLRQVLVSGPRVVSRCQHRTGQRSQNLSCVWPKP